jgi:hypothetical protein
VFSNTMDARIRIRSNRRYGDPEPRGCLTDIDDRCNRGNRE